MGNGVVTMRFLRPKDSGGATTKQKVDYKSRMEQKLCLAREDPEPVFDLTDCNLKDVPSGVFSLCKVFRKETLLLQENQLCQLQCGGKLDDLILLQVMDLRCNRFTKLPEEIGLLANLQILRVDDNKLKQLPDSIGLLTSLRTLTASKNRLKFLPKTIGRLHRMESFDIRDNPTLNQLPKELCQAVSLLNLQLDPAVFVFPASNILSEGTEATMTFLCTASGVVYISPMHFTFDDTDTTSNKITQNLKHMEESDNVLQIKLRELEKRKNQKQSEMLIIQQELEGQQQRELEIATSRKLDQEKLLEDLAEQQAKLEADISIIQEQRELEKSNLVKYLSDVESSVDELITQLLAISDQQRDPKALAEVMEQERLKMETLLTVQIAEYDSLRRNDVLGAMQSLLDEEYKREELRRQYQNDQQEFVQLALSSEIAMDSKIENVLSSGEQDRCVLIRSLLTEEKFQREAVATLLLRQDERNLILVQQIAVIQQELAQLTLLEAKKRDLQMDFEMNALCEKRHLLTELLCQFMDQQQKRKEELLRRLEEAEQRRNDELQDYWLIQYQKLMDNKPAELIEKEISLEPMVRELLANVGMERYVTIFAHRGVTMRQLCKAGFAELKEFGVILSEHQELILQAIEAFTAGQHVVSQKLARIMSEDCSVGAVGGSEEVKPPTAPPATPKLERFDTGERTVDNECVVCMDERCGLIFVPCGHVCCCKKCGDCLQSCPMCRQDITQKVQIFFN